MRGGVGRGKGDAEDGVGTDVGLVGRAVDLEHQLVDRGLLGGVESDEFGSEFLIDGLDGLEDAFAEVARLVAVAEFPGFVLAGAGAARDRSAADGAAFEFHIDFDGGIAAGVNDLTGADVGDGRFEHGSVLRLVCS